MHNLPNTASIKFDLYQLHKSFGLSILALTLVRIAWRLTHRPPALPPTTPAWQALAARAMHFAFYVLMIATPLVGLAMVSVSPKGVPTEYFGVLPIPHLPFWESAKDAGALEATFADLHEFLAFSILGLFALHVGAALKHGLVDRDGVLRSMAQGGASVMAGLGVIFGALIVGMVIYGVSRNTPTSAPRPVIAAETGPAFCAGTRRAINWKSDQAQSALGFTGVEKGREFSGRFAEFETDIAFYPDDLEASWLRATVFTSSVAVGDSIIDETIREREWFDVDDHSVARFTACSIRETGNGFYAAEGDLVIKDQSVPVTLPFSLEITGDTASAKGRVTLIRTDFDLGASSSWLTEEEVALAVGVDIEISATRIP